MNKHIKKINKSLIYGWLLIILILFVSYSFEVVKGERSYNYLVVFTAITAIPALVVYIRYLIRPDRYSLRYEYIAGYFIMYAFVLMTGSTTMVFSYILPMLSLLVLFHEPVMILVTGAISILLNLISIWFRYQRGELNIHNIKDVEIQLALIFLCFLGSWLAARLYNDIQRKNEEYTARLHDQNEKMQHMTMETITTIANTIDAKDEYTRGHSRRVAEYAAAIAAETGMSEKEITDIRSIGLLHDIGKIGIPDSVLNKPGKLTTEEFQVMKSHTVVGADILKDIAVIDGLDTGAKYHHERYDGKGYPDGLTGEEIPTIARIIAVADAYDAMSSNRVYRRHLPPEKTMEELKNGVGTQWDPVYSSALIRLIEDGRIPKVNQDDDTEMVQQATTILTRVIDYAGIAAGGGLTDMDELTGVFGRDSGRNAIQAAISKCGRGCLFLFDIDHFHRINQVEGFVAGDTVLKALVSLIRELSDDMIISRFGADEFLAYIPECEDSIAASALAESFYTMLRKKSESDGSLSRLSASIGIVEVFTEKDRIMVLYENANKALYVAKQQGGNTYYCHHMEMVEDDFPDDTVDIDLKQLVRVIKSREYYKGGFRAAYPEFGRMAEFISSLANRNNQHVQIVLFTMKSTGPVKVKLTERDRVMNLLRNAIVSSIRNVDVLTRYSSTQFAVLLMNLTTDKTDIVINRIMKEFLRTYDGGEFVVHYDTADLEEEDLEEIQQSDQIDQTDHPERTSTAGSE